MISNVAITGTPGTGKTTLALALSAEFAVPVLSTGDIARAVDPTGLAQGGMADEAAFRSGFKALLSEYGPGPFIMDGVPRSQDQVELLPSDTVVLFLRCRRDIAVDRLLRRGRQDDLPVLIARRLEEQSLLLEADVANGWAYRLAGWSRTRNTSMIPPDLIAAQAIAYLRGESREIF